MIDPRREKGDFADLCRIAADAMGSDNPELLAILEKDYWVTRVLCAIADEHADVVVFKGGTSLSKGWTLTQRFSEDIDLAVDVSGRGESARDTLMKAIAKNVADRCDLPMMARESGRGVHRAVAYGFEAIWSGGELVTRSVLLEMGTRSTLEPAYNRSLTTLLSNAVPRASAELPMCTLPVLGAERTLVEKLFVIHGAVSRHINDPSTPSLSRVGRHYYDVAKLLDDEAIRATVGTSAFWAMAADHDVRGGREFPRSHLAPKKLDFADSPGLFPDDKLRSVLQREYQRDQGLFFGASPTFDEILERLRTVRTRLVPTASIE